MFYINAIYGVHWKVIIISIDTNILIIVRKTVLDIDRTYRIWPMPRTTCDSNRRCSIVIVITGANVGVIWMIVELCCMYSDANRKTWAAILTYLLVARQKLPDGYGRGGAQLQADCTKQAAGEDYACRVRHVVAKVAPSLSIAIAQPSTDFLFLAALFHGVCVCACVCVCDTKSETFFCPVKFFFFGFVLFVFALN